MIAFLFNNQKPAQRLMSFTIAGFAASLLTILLINGNGVFKKDIPGDTFLSTHLLKPWEAVGGCGAGGGSGAGASIDWIGQGVSGGYVDFQFMPSFSATSKVPGSSITESKSLTLPITATIHIRSLALGITVPFKSATCSKEPGTISTTGLGDISLSLSRPLGTENQFSLSVGLSLPTGRYDIFQDGSTDFVAAPGQMGTGVLSANGSLSLTKDKDWGLYIFGIDYSAGLFYKKGVEFTYDTDMQHHMTDKHTLAYAREGQEPFAYKNFYNSISADNLGLKFITAVKQEHLHHSFHVKAGIPLNPNGSASLWECKGFDETSSGSKSWEDAEEAMRTFPDSAVQKGTIIDVTEDEMTGEKTWWALYENELSITKFKSWPTLTLGYGMEIFNPIIPFFWAISFPIKFDFDNKIGVSGFSIQTGIKLIAF